MEQCCHGLFWVVLSDLPQMAEIAEIAKEAENYLKEAKEETRYVVMFPELDEFQVPYFGCNEVPL